MIKKSIFILLLFLFIYSQIFSDSIINKIDELKETYNENDYETSLKLINEIKQGIIEKQNENDFVEKIFVGDLMNEYNSNELRAGKKYFGKEVIIEGYVYSIDVLFDPREKNTPDGEWHKVPEVDLADTPYKSTPYRIKIYFNEDDTDDISDLSIEDKILVKGTVYKNYSFIVDVIDSDLLNVMDE